MSMQGHREHDRQRERHAEKKPVTLRNQVVFAAGQSTNVVPEFPDSRPDSLNSDSGGIILNRQFSERKVDHHAVNAFGALQFTLDA